MPYVPPWLDVTPQSFVQASEEGERLGLERRGQDIGQQESQARQSMAQAEMQQNAQMEHQKQAATMQMAQQRLGLQTQLAARKFQQQQAYQQAIQSGMDPIQAMMQFGPGMDQSMAGVGQLGLMEMRQKQADLPPQFLENPNDPQNPYAVRLGGQWQKLNQPKAKAGIPDATVAAKKADQAIKYKSANPEATDAEARKFVNSFYEPENGDTDATPNPDEPEGSAQFNYDPKTGQFQSAGGQ